MEDDLKKNEKMEDDLKKREDDLKKKMEDEPINPNQPNWLWIQLVSPSLTKLNNGLYQK